jgi:hypothetical protein
MSLATFSSRHVLGLTRFSEKIIMILAGVVVSIAKCSRHERRITWLSMLASWTLTLLILASRMSSYLKLNHRISSITTLEESNLIPPDTGKPESNSNAGKGEKSRLRRGLAKMGIRTSKSRKD